MKILTINAGSSSIKASLFEAFDGPPGDEPAWQAHLDWSRDATKNATRANLRIIDKNCLQKESVDLAPSTQARIDVLLDSIGQQDIDIVGHRVVHGGHSYSKSVLIDKAVKAEISKLEEFAPLHNRINLEVIETMEKRLPKANQIAVFDTAFHSTMPEYTSFYATPYQFHSELGIKRFGFHGISHQFANIRAARILDKPKELLKMVTCHLGNGCSLAAIDSGKSIDTTMGFTPLAGLMMGSRSGSIDPGIIFHLLKEKLFSTQQLEDLLNYESGLKGISGISNDLRQITQAFEKGDKQAALAIDMFVHSVAGHAAKMVASLGGLDVLVFTAGIGENSALIRERVCLKLAYLGIRIDKNNNNLGRADTIISKDDSQVDCLIVRAREDLMIAFECFEKLTNSQICF